EEGGGSQPTIMTLPMTLFHGGGPLGWLSVFSRLLPQIFCRRARAWGTKFLSMPWEARVDLSHRALQHYHCAGLLPGDCVRFVVGGLCQFCRGWAGGHRCRGHMDQGPSRSDSHWPIRRATISNPPPGRHRQSNAPAASDRLVPMQHATPATRQRPRPDARICGGEGSFFTSLSLYITPSPRPRRRAAMAAPR